MLLSEPQASPYDWRFRFFQFPVRVTWLFWAVTAAFGYSQSLSMHNSFIYHHNISSSFAVLLVVWVLTAFVSILVHELGHALAFRYYGIECEIVLYQMGGLAIPGAGFIWARQGKRTRLTHQDQLVISAAGPAIQLLLAAIVGGLAFGCGVRVYAFDWLSSLIGLQLPTTRVLENPYAFCAINFLVGSSIYWALLNLLPIFPLDGGQIARHLIGIVMRRDGLYEACCLGAVVGALAAYWLLTNGVPIGGLFFASLAYSNLQTIQSARGGGSWW
jgi:stage IV sporulation protein FB